MRRVGLYPKTGRIWTVGWRREEEIGDDSDEPSRKERDRQRFRERKKKQDPEEKRDRRREELKEAAIDIFAERGFHAAKVSDIVEQVGVAQGTFYLHYDGKKQLFEEILTDFLSLLLKTISSWEPGALDTREALERELIRVGTRLTEVLYDRQRLAAIYFKESMAISPEFETLVRDFHEALVSMLTEFNEILHERGLIASANYRILADMTIGMVERIIREYVIHDNFDEVPHEELVEHLVIHYLSGTTEPMSS